MINRKDPLPITKQCHILELSRSSVYYMPAQISDKDVKLMRLIDEIHLEEPHLGSRGMKGALRMRGYTTGRIHVRTLMRKVGIEAIYRKPHLSKPHQGHSIYPYLLRGLDITEANAVWCSDITYIPMHKDSATSWPLWTGQAGKYYHGDYRTHWIPHSALRPLKKLFGTMEHRVYSIPTRAVSSRLWSLQIFLQTMVSGSAWTDRVAGETMYLLNVSGKQSNIKRYT